MLASTSTSTKKRKASEGVSIPNEKNAKKARVNLAGSRSSRRLAGLEIALRGEGDTEAGTEGGDDSLGGELNQDLWVDQDDEGQDLDEGEANGSISAGLTWSTAPAHVADFFDAHASGSMSARKHQQQADSAGTEDEDGRASEQEDDDDDDEEEEDELSDSDEILSLSLSIPTLPTTTPTPRPTALSVAEAKVTCMLSDAVVAVADSAQNHLALSQLSRSLLGADALRRELALLADKVHVVSGLAAEEKTRGDALQAELKTLQARNAELDARIAALDGSASEREAWLAGMQARVRGLEASADEEENAIKGLEAENVSLRAEYSRVQQVMSALRMSV
ncbi:unnamed protein product [Mycena citricolor]|uniref:Uncharacterized protein n=1 Tax=Mycena citricolor TaxID=2018698 RepID=A0AAD2H1P7_9AGAR|nr:unnamed protein product [Mycena citricolor]